MNHTIYNQVPMMGRTKLFIEKYGCKVKWIAEKLIFLFAVCPVGSMAMNFYMPINLNA